MTRLLASSNRAPLALPGALLITACALALTATPAQAEQVHQLLKSFSLPESASPHEPAVNQSTGEVYVSDEGGAVYAFEASGAPDPTRPVLTEADGTTPFHFQLSYGVAVDNSGGPITAISMSPTCRDLSTLSSALLALVPLSLRLPLPIIPPQVPTSLAASLSSATTTVSAPAESL